MADILNGKIVRDERLLALSTEIDGFKSKPTLAIVQIGNNADSVSYIRQKKIFGEKIGINIDVVNFNDGVVESEVLSKVKELNADKSVNGIILQLPIPGGLSKFNILETIDPNKDVDGLHSKNVKKLWGNIEGGFIPATAKGVMTLLDYYNIRLEGKKAVVVGRSELVGKPTAHLLTNRDATVTVAHSKTEDLAKVTKEADILVVATGKPGLITSSHVREGQVVIDVGININEKKLDEEIPQEKRGEIVGDVAFMEVSNIVGAISPVPGGVGPMTILSLLENVVQAYKLQNK